MTTQADLKIIASILKKPLKDLTRWELVELILYYKDKELTLTKMNIDLWFFAEELDSKYTRCFIATSVIVACFIWYIITDLWM